MYPNELFFGLTLYEVFIVLGIFAAMLLYRRYSTRAELSAKLHNLVILSAVCAVVGGYLSGVLFQAVYNWLDGGSFSLDGTGGSTFLGGFLGGLALLCAVYFGVGGILFPKTGEREHIVKFPAVMDGLAVSVALGHGFGRIGCLMAGCCHGLPSAHGIYFQNLGCRAIPTQLYEALFLFALSFALWFLVKRFPSAGLGIYFVSYGAWRFFIEFFRGDERGKTVVPFLTPSQLIAVLLIFSGIVLLIARAAKRRRTHEE